METSSTLRKVIRLVRHRGLSVLSEREGFVLRGTTTTVLPATITVAPVATALMRGNLSAAAAAKLIKAAATSVRPVTIGGSSN
jgi:hypothetical protein